MSKRKTHIIIFLRVWLVENIENTTNNAEKLIDIYPDDIEKDFIEEVVQFKNIICNFSIENKSSLLNT